MMMRPPALQLELVSVGALLIGCNAILGIDSDYHRVSNGVAGQGNGGKVSAGGSVATGGHHSAGRGGAGGSEAGASSGGEAGEGGVGANGEGGVGANSQAGEGGVGANGGSNSGSGGNGGVSASGGSAGSARGGRGGANASGGKSGAPAGGNGAVTGGTGGQGTGGLSGGTGGGTATGGSAGTATGGTGGSIGAGGTSGGGGTSGSSGTGGTGGSGAGGTGGGSTGPTVNVGQTKQVMDGFGISDLWAPALTSAQADTLFDVNKGIGLSMLRIGMDTTGAPLTSTTWADIALAKARGVGTFFATVPSAPASCKSNNNVNNGGHLLSSCYDSWSTTIASFAAAVKTNAAVDLAGISPANQPDFASCGTASPCNGNYASMLFTANEMVLFVKSVGPKLHALNPPVKLLSPEPAEWLHLWSNNSAAGSSNPLAGSGYDYGHALYADSTAWGLIDVIATQQYDTQVAEQWPSEVSGTKTLWMTEMSGIKWWPEQGPSSDISNGVIVASWIHDAIVNGGASAWSWFWYQATNTDDNEGLVLKNGTVAKRLYTLGNFSKFIRPGYSRVNVTGTIPAGVSLSGYVGPGNTVVIVAINTGASLVSFPLSVVGASPTSFVPWVTSSTDNLASKSAVTVSGGYFTASLGPTSVTTFVGGP
jgi:glucuronoarabinoxylan endo-1,4-beta-xylanase